MTKSAKPASSWVGYAGLGLGVILIVLLLSSIDLKASFKLVGTIGFPAVLILLPYLGLHLIETSAWIRVFPPGAPHVFFWPLFRIQVISETVSMTIPAGMAIGEPIRPWLCRRFMGLPLPASVASVAVRKLMLGGAQGIYTLIGAIAGFSFLAGISKAITGYNGLEWILAASGIVVFLVFFMMLLFLLNGEAAGWLHGMLVKVPFRKVRQWLLDREHSFVQTDRELGSYHASFPALSVAAIEYVASWATLAIESYVILLLLGVDISFVEVLAIDTALALLRAIFFFIPSGLGVQDIGYIAFFKAAGIADPVLYGGAFILLRRFKEVIWYAIGYGWMFLSGIHLHDATHVREADS